MQKVKVTNQVTLSHLTLSVGSVSPHPHPLPPQLLRPASPLGFVLEGGHSHGWKVASRPAQQREQEDEVVQMMRPLRLPHEPRGMQQ